MPGILDWPSSCSYSYLGHCVLLPLNSGPNSYKLVLEDINASQLPTYLAMTAVDVPARLIIRISQSLPPIARI